MSTRPRTLVALSGGVDSAVAALLLREQGHDVVCAYMKNWINEDGVIGDCPWEQDITDARAVAATLGLEFHVVNLMRDYRARIVDYLLAGYASGLTPNPDVMCNREIKFGVFLQWARDQGFARVATGHYARRVESGGNAECRLPIAESASGDPFPSDDRPGAPLAPNHEFSLRTSDFGLRTSPELWEGADKNKDQSYFLALLRPEQLEAALFPVGDLPKPEVRRLATAARLPNAAKKDSQGICFIGQVRMADFLRTYVPDRPGPIVRATDGVTLGEHRGLHTFTLGQRKGIGIPSNSDHHAYVVVGKRAADNALLVAFDSPAAPGLWTHEVTVHSLSWLIPPPAAPCTLEGRVRYRDPRVPLDFTPRPDGSAHVRFHAPQRGLAAGQVLALHVGERLVGGGIYA